MGGLGALENGHAGVVGHPAPKLRPFLKWAGGKRWLAQRYLHLFPSSFIQYIEPFIGSGAIYFSLAPEYAVLSDSNEELINAYEQVRDNWRAIQAGLRAAHARHSEEFYYDVRRSVPSNEIEKAIRFIYLNRTCWNGLYRVNRSGNFNVPIGTKSKVDMDDDFASLSSCLKKSVLAKLDFEASMEHAGSRDLIYVDPPYTVRHNNNGFVKYNEVIFSWADQIRLRDAVRSAIRRGAFVIVSNADHPSIRELYSGMGEIIGLSRASVISGLGEGRGRYGEVLIRCF